MPRLFVSLAIGQLIVMLGAGAFGLAGSQDRHIILALFALLLSAFIQIATFTYFTVSGKMIAQAVHLGQFDSDPLEKTKQFKRSMTIALGVVLASVILMTGSGAARWRSPDGSALHLMLTCVGFLVHGWAYYYEYHLVSCNAFLFEKTLRAYTEKKQAEAL